MAMLLLLGSFIGCSSEAPPPDVILYGDSISRDAKVPIQNAIAGVGLTFTSRASGGLALCDQLDQMRSDATRTHLPKAAVLAWNGNNITPCMAAPDGSKLTGQAMRDKVYADLSTAHRIWLPHRVPVVLLGAIAMSPNNTADFDQPDHIEFDKMLRQAATDFGFTYEDTTPDLTPGNVFTETMPCARYESVDAHTCTGPIIDGVQNNAMRSADGLHLCPPGDGPPNHITPDCQVYASSEVRWANHVLHGVEAVVATTTTTSTATTTTTSTATTVPNH